MTAVETYRPAADLYLPIARGEHASTNGGLSDRTEAVIVTTPERYEAMPLWARRSLPFVFVEVWWPTGHLAVKATPAAPSPEGETSYMAGGNALNAATHAPGADHLREWLDERGYRGRAIPLHDRTETWDLYRALSSD